MRIKDSSVELEGLREPILRALFVCDQLHIDLCGVEVTVTSAAEKIEHSVRHSAHYRGDAVDLRNWQLAGKLPDYVRMLKAQLGPDFTVIDEHSHIHVHWSPIYHGDE